MLLEELNKKKKLAFLIITPPPYLDSILIYQSLQKKSTHFGIELNLGSKFFSKSMYF